MRQKLEKALSGRLMLFPSGKDTAGMNNIVTNEGQLSREKKKKNY